MFPLILEEIRFQQNQYPQAVYGIIDVPLLIENPQFLALVDRVLVIDVAEEVQIRRVRQRSGLDESEIRRYYPHSDFPQDRLLHADDVLVNEVRQASWRQKSAVCIGFIHMRSKRFDGKEKTAFCRLFGCLAR